MWPFPPLPLAHRALGLALAGGLAAAALAGCGDDAEPASSATDPAASSSAASPSPSSSTAPQDDTTPEGDATTQDGATTDAAPSASASPTSTTAVPVYFVADAPRGPRLFREFRSVDAADPMLAAAALLTGGGAQDPDYTSLLPTGALAGARQVDGAIEVVLPDESWTTRPAGTTKAQARLAVQQLVYTLQGVVQARDPLRAVLTEGGRAVPLLGVPTGGGGVAQADPLEVLGLVNVTTPEQGTAVTGSLTASGVASSFEGTVPWEVRSGGRTVLDGFATAEGYLDRLYPWTTEVDVSDLAPGTYTFVASTSDPSGGEGPGPTVDTKDFRVE